MTANGDSEHQYMYMCKWAMNDNTRPVVAQLVGQALETKNR